MQQNPDQRPLPPGCDAHFDAQRGRWYYVHLQMPPRVTFIHPADETPRKSVVALPSPPQQSTASSRRMSTPSRQPLPRPTSVQRQLSHGNRSIEQRRSPVRDSSGQQQNSSPTTVNNPSPFVMYGPRQPSESVYSTSFPQTPTLQVQPLYRKMSIGQNTAPRQPSEAQSVYSTSFPQNATVQREPSFGNTHFEQDTFPVQDYPPVQQRRPSMNNQPSHTTHRRQPSEAQSIYSTSFPQSPSDHSRFSIYTNSSDQDGEFDASILYASPVSSSPPVRSPAAVSPTFQPQRHHAMSLDDSEIYASSLSNQAAYHPRSRSVQASPAADQRFQPNILRRKTKKASTFGAISGNTTKPVQPIPTYQKPSDVPVYNLVAQAPLDTTTKATTPSFQTLLYSKPPLAPLLPDPSENSNEKSGPLEPSAQTQTAAPSNQVSSEPTMMQGLLNSQFPLSMQTNHSTQTSASTTALPTQPFSPLRAQTFSAGTGPSHVPSMLTMNNSLLPRTQSTPAASNGMAGQAPLMINQPFFMPARPLDGFSNGTTALPMAFNQPQYMRLNGLSNGTMSIPAVSPPATVSPTFMLPQIQQESTSLPNGLAAQHNAMAQSSLPTMLPPQQTNMLPNGYAALPSGVTLIPGGMTSQTPGVTMIPNNTAQQTAQAEPKNNKNKQLMKKVGLSLGRSALRMGTKYALQSIGVDESLAGVAARATVSGVTAVAKMASGSGNNEEEAAT